MCGVCLSKIQAISLLQRDVCQTWEQENNCATWGEMLKNVSIVSVGLVLKNFISNNCFTPDL